MDFFWNKKKNMLQDIEVQLGTVNDSIFESKQEMSKIMELIISVNKNQELLQEEISALKLSMCDNYKKNEECMTTLVNKAETALKESLNISSGVETVATDIGQNHRAMGAYLQEVMNQLNKREKKSSDEQASLEKKYDSINEMVTEATNKVTKGLEMTSAVAEKVSKNYQQSSDIFEQLNMLVEQNKQNRGEIEKKVERIGEDILSNIANIDEATRLLLVHSVMNYIPGDE